MISAQHLTKRYGQRVAVRDVSFDVQKGEVVGFLGPNGAGKSTTLRMLTGFLAPSEGAITVDGVDAIQDSIEARRRIGYMPESVPLYLEMRVEEFLRYRAALKGVARREIAKRVDASLAQANVGDVRTRIIGQLSKGYRQRVGLADALVADPPLLILDEPTAGLDPNQIRQVRDLVKGLAGTKTVLLSTHILPEVEATCSRVIIIHQGRVVGEGAPDSLRNRKAGARVFVLTTKADPSVVKPALEKIEGARAVHVEAPDAAGVVEVRIELESAREDIAEEIFRAIAAAGLAVRALREEAASLESVFTELTTTEAAAPVEAAASPEDGGET